MLGNSASHAIGSTGGSETVTLTVAQMPRHNHEEYLAGSSSGYSIYKFPGSTGSYSGATIALNLVSNVNNASSGDVKTSYNGSSNPHSNMPPYYVLAYIMKL